MTEKRRSLEIKKVYLKHCAFEASAAPGVFLEERNNTVPVRKTDLGIEVDSVRAADGLHEVSLHLTVSVERDDGAMLFVIEIHQSGLFALSGFSPEEAEKMLGIYCPEQLYPYARAAISDLSSRSGFPPLLLDPVDFELIYQNQSR